MNSRNNIHIGRRVSSLGLGEGISLKTKERATHMHIIGATGQGKSSCIEHMFLQDIQGGGGALIDPMGDLTTRILDRIPQNRIKDTLVFRPEDTARPVPFNILALGKYAESSKIKSMTVKALRSVWHYSWGPELENLLSKSISTLLEIEVEPTLLGIERILTDGEYRFRCIQRLRDQDLVSYWTHQFEPLSRHEQLRKASSTLNKVTKFREAPLKNIFGQGTNTYDLRTLVDKQKILLVDLCQGSRVIGSDEANILGSLWLTVFQLIGFSRGDLPSWKRAHFPVYVEECSSYIPASLPQSISQLRAFGISFIFSHQYLGQLPARQEYNVRDALLGNIGTLLAFRVGSEDAHVLSRQFDGEVHPNQLTDLSPGYAYMKRPVKDELPFKVKLARSPFASLGHACQVRRFSRRRFGRKRRSVERTMLQWSKPQRRR